MERRSDLRNPDFFPPGLDIALVIPFSAWCWLCKDFTVRAHVLLLFILPSIPTEAPVAVQSVACKPSFSQQLLKHQAELFQLALWSCRDCLLLLSAVIARQAELLATGCGSAFCTCHLLLELSGCSRFPFKNKEEKVILDSVLRMWIALQDAIARWLLRQASFCFTFK